MNFWTDVFMYYDTQNLMSWHRWFAWHPVRLNDGKLCWLKYVNRVYQMERDEEGITRIKLHYERIK